MGKVARPIRVTSVQASNEAREAIDVVGGSVNSFMEEAYVAIMGNLSVTDNLNMEFKQFKITVDASGIPVKNVKFQTGLRSKSAGMIVIRVFGAIPTTQPFITFSENSGVITINHVSGLVAGTEYQFTVLSIGT